MGFDVSLLVVLDVQIWASFDPILEWRENEGLGMGHNYHNFTIITIITISKNWSHKWITNLEKNMIIEFDLFNIIWNIVYKFDPVLAQFWFYDVTRFVKFPNFGKMTFGKVPRLGSSFAVWSWYVALKLLWRIWEKWRQKGGPRFTPSSNYFAKILKLKF